MFEVVHRITFFLFLARRTGETPAIQNALKVCMLVGLTFLISCESRYATNGRHISLGIFEVIDCTAKGSKPISVKGSAETYCLSAKPVVDQTDVRLAEARRDESGNPVLDLYFTLKTGERMKGATERLYAEHLRRNDQARMGIVIDGVLVSAPVLRGSISDMLQISGAFSQEDAVQIAQSLNFTSRQSSSNGQ